MCSLCQLYYSWAPSYYHSSSKTSRMLSSFRRRYAPVRIDEAQRERFTCRVRLQVRQVVSDFAVIIAIFSMSALDHFVNIPTPKLEVPEEFKPTLHNRGWMIWPFQNNPWWSAIVACLPALLGTILIFMDQQITAVIVNRKENKLKASLLSRFSNDRYDEAPRVMASRELAENKE